jgi:hypothetical protein
MPTHETTQCPKRIERFIIPENLVELSLAVLEIIRGQKYFFKNGIPRYLWTGSEFFTKQQIFQNFIYTAIIIPKIVKFYLTIPKK